MTEDAIRARLKAALDRLDRPVADDEDRSLSEYESVLRSVLAELGGTIGECRREVPYAPLQPVIQPTGQLKWCCTHAETHCGEP